MKKAKPERRYEAATRESYFKGAALSIYTFAQGASHLDQLQKTQVAT